MASVALCPSGLVTVTERVPVVALAVMVMLAVICEDELSVQEFTVKSAPKLQVAPPRKFVPVRMTFRFWLCWPEAGEMLIKVGGGGGGA